MAKEKKGKETEKSSDDEMQIKFLREQISNIKNKGKFSKIYKMLRTESNNIRKSEDTDKEKKEALILLCENITEEINTTL